MLSGSCRAPPAVPPIPCATSAAGPRRPTSGRSRRRPLSTPARTGAPPPCSRPAMRSTRPGAGAPAASGRARRTCGRRSGAAARPGEARELGLEERRGFALASGLGQRLRVVVDQLQLVRIARQRGLETRDGEVELSRFHQHVAGHRLDHRVRRGDLLERGELGDAPAEIPRCAGARRRGRSAPRLRC